MKFQTLKLLKTLAISLVTAIAVVGCSSAGNGGGGESSPVTSKTTPVESPSATKQESGEFSYPVNTDQTLTYWGEYQTTKPKIEDVPLFQELQKRTGIPLAFVSPPAGQAVDAMNILLASGDYPDMFQYDWFNFPGGPEKAIADGYILRLNDVIDQYAPNLKKYLEENPEIDKMVKTDNGSYYTFPFLRGDPVLQVFQGPIVRGDWLKELNIPVPETIEDWHAMLLAFKEKKDAASPLSYNFGGEFLDNGAFMSAFGATRSWFHVEGEVRFGPMEPGYKEFLRTFNQWYSEGLLDKNIANVDFEAMDASVIGGATGATVLNAGFGIGKWTPLLKEKDPNSELIAVSYPVLRKGELPMFSQMDSLYSPNGGVAISATSKNVELAARMLDWGYSEEGHLFYNFGQEGVSYEMKDGNPVYTDLLMKNPDGLNVSQAMSLYIRANSSGPFVQDKRYIEQYYALPQQVDAVKTWSKSDVAQYKLPTVTATPEEATDLAQIMNDVNTLVDEMTLKIILGNEPIDAYDSYMDKLKSLRIDRAIEIQQTALDRYNSR